MAEYIKREDVLKILSEKNAPWNGYVNCKELPAEDVQPMRWIPVTERLPEEKTYVLILADTIAGKMAKVSFLYKDSAGKNCWTALDEYGKNLFDWQPTHWMSLPELPKEGET